MVFDTYGNPENPKLILLHGAAALDTFAHQYDALAKRFYVLVPHLPGAGEAAAEAYNPQETCDALAAWIASLGTDRVRIMGHSIGAQLAVKLVSEHEALFCRAVFLSAWLISSEKSVKNLSILARLSYGAIKSANLLRLQAKYWGMTPEQGEKLVTYSQRIKLNTYVGFFANRILLRNLPGYASVRIPMLAICAKGETAEMKASLDALGKQNTNCLTVVFPQGSHVFVLRNYGSLNPMLLDFLTATEPPVYC